MTKSNHPPKVVRSRIETEQHDDKRLKSEFSNSHLNRRTEVAFIESNRDIRKKCENALSIKNLVFKSFPSFEAVLNLGIDRSASIFILPESFPNASRSSFSKLLCERSKNQIRVIIYDESPIEILVASIKESLDEIYHLDNRKFVINRILKLNSQSAKKPLEKGGQKTSDVKLIEFLNKELLETPDQSPDQILAKAIQVIKNLK
jgi:FixJ family two-component response regulator